MFSGIQQQAVSGQGGNIEIQSRRLKTISDVGYAYPDPSGYTTGVKAVDTLGCDTSITIGV